MKVFFNYIFKNSWNLFGPLGIVTSLYLSIYYVPAYVKEISYGKNRIMHESLMNDVEEYIFHNKVLESEDIESFIKGKELKYGIPYIYSTRELLLQVQDSFVTNKFIPLDKRDDIVKVISSIDVKEEVKTEKSMIDKAKGFLPLLASIVGIIITIIGAVSFYKKYEKDRETTIDIDSIEEQGEDIVSSYNPARAYYEYESLVQAVLDNLKIKYEKDVCLDHKISQLSADFVIYQNNEKIVVECKKYKKLMGVGSASKIVHDFQAYGNKGILIVSSGLTKRAREVFEKHNELHPETKILIVIGDQASKIEKDIKSVLSQHSKT